MEVLAPFKDLWLCITTVQYFKDGQLGPPTSQISLTCFKLSTFRGVCKALSHSRGEGWPDPYLSIITKVGGNIIERVSQIAWKVPMRGGCSDDGPGKCCRCDDPGVGWASDEYEGWTDDEELGGELTKYWLKGCIADRWGKDGIENG